MPVAERQVRRPLRLISTLDRLGLRYLSADAAVAASVGAWPLPLAVATRDDAGPPETWRESPLLDSQLRRAAELDGRFEALTLKTGQLLVTDCVDRVAEYLEERRDATVVLDAELFDADGRPRSGGPVRRAVAEKLLPRCQVVLGNRFDAAALTGRDIDGPSSMREACRALFDRGAEVAIVTGGHLDGSPSDVFYDGSGYEELGGDRVSFSGVCRGAGGVLSATLAAHLACGRGPLAAAHAARQAASRALALRLWVTRQGALSPAAADADDAPAGYWVANPWVTRRADS